MLIRFALIAFFSIILSGCAELERFFAELNESRRLPPTQESQPNMQTVNRPPSQIVAQPHSVRIPENGCKKVKLYPFHEVDIKGPFHVVIRPTKGQRRISVSGPRRTLKHMVTMVKNGRLVLDIATDQYLPGLAEVEIEVNKLTYLSYAGNGDLRMSFVKAPSINMYIATVGDVNIEGHKIGLNHLTMNGSGNIVMSGISSRRLEIDSKGNDRLAITGVASLRELIYGGNSRISMYWITSPHLTVYGTGEGYAKLAGHTDMLEAEIYHHATFDAKYLRAHRTFVKTFNFAEAHIQSVRDQNTLAEEKSNIYYYHTAKFNKNYMADNGAVLDNMAFARK